MSAVIEGAVKERPILFSGPMVRAILDGRKTQTRRIVKLRPGQEIEHGAVFSATDPFWMIGSPFGKPGDRVWVRESWQIRSWDTEEGDVQVFYKASPEIYWSLPVAPLNHPFAGDDPAEWTEHDFDKVITNLPSAKIIKDPEVEGGERWDWDDSEIPWRPSIHMPRWACRIVLEVTDVRVERLQAITVEDAEAEGAIKVGPIETFPHRRLYGFDMPIDEFWRQSPVDAYMHLWDKINGAGSWDSNPWVWVVSFKRIEPKTR